MDGRTFPNFFIVGAMKAGTTALGSYLAQHPDLVFGERTNYFDQDRKYQLGPDWYAGFFQHARDFKAVGEKVPAYSYRPGKAVPVPERIQDLLPQARIIWILRNPVDRAYSHYWFDVFMGKERRPFNDVLEYHGRHGATPPHDYRGRGVYVEQIRLYLRYFSPEQMHIMLLKDLKEDAVAAVNGVFAFLELDPGAVVLKHAVEKNHTYRPLSARLQWLLSKALHHRKPRLQYRLARLASRRQPGYPPMDSAVRDELERFYAPHNRALSELTGLDLSHWMPAG